MTQPGIELVSPGSLANTLTIMPMSSKLFCVCVCVYIYIYIYIYVCMIYS